MKIAVLADTHIPKRAKALPERAIAVIQNADAIIHAGDVLTEEFLSSLNAMAPVYAVLGNNDVGLKLPERIELGFEGVNIAVVHDSGASKGRGNRMRRWFPNAHVVVFGHSHIPMNVIENGVLLFNPGSATDKRSQPTYTMGLLDCTNERVSGEIITL